MRIGGVCEKYLFVLWEIVEEHMSKGLYPAQPLMLYFYLELGNMSELSRRTRIPYKTVTRNIKQAHKAVEKKFIDMSDNKKLEMYKSGLTMDGFQKKIELSKWKRIALK